MSDSKIKMTRVIPEKNWITPKAVIKPAKTHGAGLFAVEPIQQGETVIIWGGHNYTNKKGAEKAFNAGKQTMQWDDDVFSFETGSDDAYSINHSCDSNLWMDGAFALIAKRTIEKNEELTADYALWESNEDYVSNWTCACGNACCRKRVTGRDYQLKDVQDRYQGHFSPLINKRIARPCEGAETTPLVSYI